MCDFHDRLLASIAKIPGVDWVKLQDGGADGFRRHTLLVGEVRGKPFRFPVSRRPSDKSRSWLNYFCALRRKIRHLGGGRCGGAPRSDAPPTKKRSNTRTAPPRSVPVPISDRAPTRLDRDPFAVLATLRSGITG